MKAGLIPEFDALAAKFFAAVSDVRSSILEEATALAKGAGATAQHYLKVMSKVVNGSEEYLQKESARSVLYSIYISDYILNGLPQN